MDLFDIWIRGCYVYKCRFFTFATYFVTYSNATTGNILFFHLKTGVKLLFNVLPPLNDQNTVLYQEPLYSWYTGERHLLRW